MAAAINDNVMVCLRNELSGQDETQWVDDFSTLLKQRNVLFNTQKLIKLGAYVSARHKKEFDGRTPHKVRRIVEGGSRMVNLYSIDKLGFVNQCIDEFLAANRV